MKCKNCGAEINDGVNFCKNCGAKVSDCNDNKSQEEIPLDSPVKQVSRQPRKNEWFCPVCGSFNQNYVGTCGCGTLKSQGINGECEERIISQKVDYAYDTSVPEIKYEWEIGNSIFSRLEKEKPIFTAEDKSIEEERRCTEEAANNLKEDKNYLVKSIVSAVVLLIFLVLIFSNTEFFFSGFITPLHIIFIPLFILCIYTIVSSIKSIIQNHKQMKELNKDLFKYDKMR